MFIYHCVNCNNTNLEHEAIVEWDYDTQQFEITHIKDQVWCEDCGSLVDYGISEGTDDHE